MKITYDVPRELEQLFEGKSAETCQEIITQYLKNRGIVDNLEIIRKLCLDIRFFTEKDSASILNKLDSLGAAPSVSRTFIPPAPERDVKVIKPVETVTYVDENGNTDEQVNDFLSSIFK